MWTNRRNEHGPFDIIGDIHGCFDELQELLAQLGYLAEKNGDGYTVKIPEGRKAIFLGDLVDRGPRIPDVLKLVMGMVESGTALCVPGNHDMKLLQKLRGKDMKIAHGLSDSLAQLEASRLNSSIRSLISLTVSSATTSSMTESWSLLTQE
jgi:protein phosphatase